MPSTALGAVESIVCKYRYGLCSLVPLMFPREEVPLAQEPEAYYIDLGRKPTVFICKWWKL